MVGVLHYQKEKFQTPKAIFLQEYAQMQNFSFYFLSKIDGFFK